MTRCPDGTRLQDHLDGLLAPAEARAVETHLSGCPACSAARARYERLFASLDALPLAEAPSGFADRVLARVRPARPGERWVSALGWGYAAAVAVCAAAILTWAAMPAGRSFATWLFGEASLRVVHALSFTVNALSFVILSLASGWGAIEAAGDRLVPLGRALTVVVSHPAFQGALGLAALTCAALTVWIKQRPARPGKGGPHVGVLGF